MATDSKYFGTTNRGEIHELKEELNHTKEDKRKEAVKKVIAAMTVGKDVSSLFTDVLNNIQTNNLELKKLVYLYVSNHATSAPDRAILCVSTFQKDCSDPNPLIRALAIRTMGCIRVDKVTEYLCEPLRLTLKDRDPYVRKTAALCVAKLHDLNRDLAKDQGFVEILVDLLSDSNPTVVANAVAALGEIQSINETIEFRVNSGHVSKLLTALNECTEWGQVFILNALSRYVLQQQIDSKEAENLAERVVPRLNHTNSAVVLASIKALMVAMEDIKNEETIKSLCKKMAPPLVTLLTTKEPEIQYVALRNINLIVQKRPNILAHEMRVFFIKYNDPVYVKMEKLEIMIMLASEKNMEQVLNEFKEAAGEVDIDFVRKAVKAIGRCAIKMEKAAEKCIQVLLDLIQTKVNHVVQEAIVVIKDIFRKYPGRYESIIATLCENLDILDEPEAKSSMIWIIGHYAEKIENAAELLDSFLETFLDESTEVQLQILTAVVKLFLKRPKDTQDMVSKVLNLASQESDNPDLRDRGYLYWRLLSTDPEAAKAVVLGQQPLISGTSSGLDDNSLKELIANISTLASVYHKPPEAFVKKIAKKGFQKETKKEEEEDPRERELERNTNILDLSETPTSPQPPTSGKPVSGNLLDDFDFLSTPAVTTPPVRSSRELVLTADKGYGLQINGAFVRREGQIFLELGISNQSGIAANGIAVQFNKNSFALFPTGVQLASPFIMPGQSTDAIVSITLNPGHLNPGPANNIIQTALKASFQGQEDKIVYFQIPIPLHVLFVENGKLEREEYLNIWKQIAEEHFRDVNLGSNNIDTITKKFETNRLFFIARRSVQQQEFLYFSAKTTTNAVLLLELALGPTGSKACVKTRNTELVPLFHQTVQSLFN